MDTRWRMLALLYLGRIAMGFQFQSIGALASFIIRDLHIDYTGLGTLVGLYMLPGVFLAVPSGLLGNRFGDRQIVVAGMASMVIGGILVGMAESFPLAALGRIMSGIGAIPIGVLMVKMVADWFVGREMVTASSVYFSGWPCGIAIGLVTQNLLAEAAGWRAVMLLSSALLAAPLVLTWFRYRAPEGAHGTAGVAAPAAGLSRREFMLVMLPGIAWACSNGSYVVLLSFTPDMLVSRGFSLAEAGAIASVHLWVSLVAMPLGGFLAQRANASTFIVVAVYFATGVLQMLVPIMSFTALPLFLYGLIGGLPSGILLNFVAQALKPPNRAVGFGVFYMFFYAGMGIGPAIAGLARDLSGGYVVPFLVSGLSIWLGIAMFLVFRIVQRRGERRPSSP